MKTSSIFVIIFVLFLSNNLYSQSFFEESGNLMIKFYQGLMAPVKEPASQCQFHPSCSNYAKGAVKEYGFLTASILAADRWARCSGGRANPEKYPVINRKFYDPPANHYLFGKGNLWQLAMTDKHANLEDINNLNRESVFGFAEFLFLRRDFDNSALELKRIQFSTKDPDLFKYLDVMVGINHLSKGSLEEAMNCIDEDYNFLNETLSWNSFVVNFLINDLQRTHIYNINYCSGKKKAFKENDEEVLKLLSYSYSRNEEYNKAIETLENIERTDGNKLLLEKSIQQLSNPGQMNTRSPFLAGVFSAIIPGSGYFYCGEIKEGLSAMIVNGLLGASIYGLFKNDNVGSGILMSAIALPFYLGNIIGSANSAALINNKSMEKYNYALRHNLKIDFYFSTDFLKNCWKALPE